MRSNFATNKHRQDGCDATARGTELRAAQFRANCSGSRATFSKRRGLETAAGGCQIIIEGMGDGRPAAA